tara:strand:+ start:1907 stop:2626 length:720 start_codon:yes stop_codon:yes gene_type:complete
VQTVYLKGELGERFGEKWTMNVSKVQDIFKLVSCQRNGFDAYMQHCIENDIDFAVQRGEDYIDESELMLSLGKDDITITPIPVGSKSKVAKLITAALMIYAGYQMGVPPEATMSTGTHSSGVNAVFATQAQVGLQTKIASWTLMALGTSMGLQTIAQMLMPSPENDNEEDSYLFSGPQNTTIQGGAVPVLYGEMIVGGANINTSYIAHQGGTNYGPGINIRLPLGGSEGAADVDMQVPD